MKITIGTRKSNLALEQTNLVVKAIQKNFPEIEFVIKPIITKGDKILNIPLRDVYGEEGKTAFTAELQEMLIAKEFDIIVHSMKDVAGNYNNKNLCFAAYLERSSPFDFLITKNPNHNSLKSLPEGANVGTVSLRRKAAILRENPNVIVENLRGTIQTRLQKLKDNFSAIIMAEAALIRLGTQVDLSGLTITKIEPNIMLPAAAQGVIGVECRDDDADIKNILQKINHQQTYYTTECERAFIKELNGNCFTVVGALAQIENDKITLAGNIADESGKYLFSITQSDNTKNYKELGCLSAQKIKQNIIAENGQAFLEKVLNIK